MATFAAQPKSDFAIWEVPGRSRRIVYSTALMRQLAADAIAASETADAEGTEIGGILFGTADDYEVRIVAHRPIRCSHPHQREFLLSSEDERGLRTQLADVANDPQLGGLVVVGWFHSHTKTPICLTAEDMRIWEIYFPMPWQVALVLRPQKLEPTRGGFFFRPASGPVRTDSSYRVFEADAEAAAVPVQPPATVSAPPPAMEAPPAHEHLAEPPPELLWQEPERPRRTLWLVGGALILLAAAGFALLRGPSGAQPRATTKEPDLNLRLINESGLLYATWDPQSPLLNHAIRGSLEMATGEKSTDLPMSPEDLQRGRLPILWGRDVRIRLIVDSLDPESRHSRVEAAAYYIGRDGGPAAPAPAPAATAELRAELARLEAEVAAETAANDILERELALEAGAVPESPEPAVGNPAPPAPTEPEATQPTSAAVTPAAAPEPDPAQANPPAPPPAAETPRPAAPPPPPVYAGPRSGRIIWTGFLAPGASITIDGRSASAGTVNAALPGIPVRMSVYPAEFTSSGISLFSANSRHASNDVTEGRSARNGWMNTRYVYDAERARDAQLVSTPSERDGFKKLVLRGGARAVAAVVIDWQAAVE